MNELLKLILQYGVQMRLVGMQTHLLEAGVHVEKVADAQDAWRKIEVHLEAVRARGVAVPDHQTFSPKSP